MDLDRLRVDALAAGRAAGLVAVGVTSADPFDDTRRDLLDRKAAGLNAGMQFTYRNPERSTDPTRALDGARALIAGAWPYPPPARLASGDDHPSSTALGGGRVAAYATMDHYAGLRQALDVVSGVLTDAGWRARVLADDNALVDRAVAVRAGLGWWGKNANVLVPGVGSWVVLGAVVTDAPLAANAEPVPDGCGACRRCIDGCPTGAIVAPGVVDARRCLAWLVQAPGSIPVEFRVALGDRIYGCDDCQEVCPPSRRTLSADAPERVDLVAMLDASDDALLVAHGRWYIADRNPAYLRRNALVALGNTGDPSDPEVVRVVVAHLRHADPMVRAHAVWSARRLGLAVSHDVVAGADDPEVAEALAASPPPSR